MAPTYCGLPQYGLPLVTPDHADFRALATAITVDPFGNKLEEAPPEGAVVLNQSGQAVLAISILSRWTDQDGHPGLHTMGGLQSLAHLDRRPENADPRSMWSHPFLPGSKRLITPHGVFGDNSDVLPPEAKPRAFGGAGGRFNRGGMPRPERTLLELQLDSAIFADGLFAGPDETGLYATIGSVAAEQRRLAAEAAALLRRGARLGDVFEVVRSAARHRPGPAAGPADARSMHLLASFGRAALDLLIHADDEHREALIPWFETQADVPRMQLRRHE